MATGKRGDWPREGPEKTNWPREGPEETNSQLSLFDAIGPRGSTTPVDPPGAADSEQRATPAPPTPAPPSPAPPTPAPPDAPLAAPLAARVSEPAPDDASPRFERSPVSGQSSRVAHLRGRVAVWRGVLVSRVLRSPPRWRWSALALLVGLVVLGWLWAPAERAVEAAPSVTTAALPVAAASPRVPVTARAVVEGGGLRVVLVGAAGRFVHVAALDDEDVVRLYPFEEGDSVLVERDAPLEGVLDLPGLARYRLFAIVSDAPTVWSAIEPALRAPSFRAQPVLAGFDVVPIPVPPKAPAPQGD